MLGGEYRKYVKLPLGLGLKFAWPFGHDNANNFAAFLAGVIMNNLERKRYLYYVKKKPMRQWGNVWKSKSGKVHLCPTYFSCGLFNVVKHVEMLPKDAELDEDEMLRRFGYLTHDCGARNVGGIGDELYLVDYGDFNVTGYNNMRVGWIDYA